MSVVEIKANSAALDTYYANLDALKKNLKLSTEGSTRRAFGRLLDDTSSVRKWTLAEEVTVRKKNHRIRLDGILYGKGSLPRGYWEAKDESDDLNTEILKKKAKQYPVNNIIFEDTKRAILIQDAVQVEDIDVTKPDDLARLLSRFYNYEMTPFEEFDKAVEWFAEVIPDIGRDLTAKIAESHKSNPKFQREFDEFMELCKTALNPNISKEAVDEMLIQHLLTERLIRNIFQSDFTQRNVIANKVEDVISALTKPLFDRSDFQKSLDSFYKVIENAANSLVDDYQAKQTFINTVYEQFFQGYSVKTADTHGIVYTPQEIVDFMCAAVEEVLADEFGKKLGQEGVAVLDPATGTGNFIINLLNRVNPKYRRDFYKKHLFANEVMLMPYYIASLNIEHEYYALEGEYEPFEGLAFVDTLDLSARLQKLPNMFTEANAERIERQQKQNITVIIGNPPYNMGQLNENDNNRNRTYKEIEGRIKESYIKSSTATLSMQLYDPYVKFFRWATDRLGDNDGIVCFVTNNGFVDGTTFDGFRKHMMDDFTQIYHLDLAGDARTTGEQRRKEGGNIFHDQIRVGVGITIAIRSKTHKNKKLFYHRINDYLRAEDKLRFLTWNVNEDGNQNALNTIEWHELKPNLKGTWLVSEFGAEFETFIPIGSKKTKSVKDTSIHDAIFKEYCRGVATNADTYIFAFDELNLSKRSEMIVKDYRSKLAQYQLDSKSTNVNEWLDVDETIHKWVRNTRRNLARGNDVTFNKSAIRLGIYRPFSKQYYYSERIFNEDVYRIPRFLPNLASEKENKVICTVTEQQIPFCVQITNQIPALHYNGRQTQCFPFYVYEEDGSNRRENITDWALAQFQAHYDDPSITKWDIFYYVYGLLHHPSYRERYADNLKRELPRIPFVPSTLTPKSPLPEGEGTSKADGAKTADSRSGELEAKKADSIHAVPTGNIGESGFWVFSHAGKELAESHLNYETGERYEGIEWEQNKDVKPSYRVEKMRPQKKRKIPLSNIVGTLPALSSDEQSNSPEITVYDSLKVNEYLTLTGIPETAFAYRLGNRSAIDWIVDQYRVKTDKRSGITSDPNGYSEDEQYIVHLVERVVQVSVDTVAIVKRLAAVEFREDA